MKNLNEDTKLKEADYCSLNEKIKRAIFKVGLQEYPLPDLYLYLEVLVEVINEKRIKEK